MSDDRTKAGKQEKKGTEKNPGTKERTERQRQRAKKRKLANLQALLIVLLFSTIALLLIAVIMKGGISTQTFSEHPKEESTEDTEETTKEVKPITSAKDAFPDLSIEEMYITPNRYSRPQIALEKVTHIVIHYTGNPGTTAKANISYFDNLKDQIADSGKSPVFASSHFVIGLRGEILQCIPLNEQSYASNHMNNCSISIEMCHPDESGAFENETYNSCVFLVAKLCNYYDIPTENVIRHYDVTGKECPKYFVDNPDKFITFKEWVDKWRKKYASEKK